MLITYIKFKCVAQNWGNFTLVKSQNTHKIMCVHTRGASLDFSWAFMCIQDAVKQMHTHQHSVYYTSLLSFKWLFTHRYLYCCNCYCGADYTIWTPEHHQGRMWPVSLNLNRALIICVWRLLSNVSCSNPFLDQSYSFKSCSWLTTLIRSVSVSVVEKEVEL